MTRYLGGFQNGETVEIQNLGAYEVRCLMEFVYYWLLSPLHVAQVYGISLISIPCCIIDME